MQYETPVGPERPAPSEAPAPPPEAAGTAPEVLSERISIAPPGKTKRPPAEADPAALGRIEIPRLGLKAIVREGADVDTLERAVGRVPGTAKPGDVGNVVLAGHRDTFFRSLRKIEVDDMIRLVVPPHTYEYRVASLRVVTPTETSVMDSNGIEELTLVTCYPFRVLGPAPDRFIVSATRVE
jgi:sortase A